MKKTHLSFFSSNAECFALQPNDILDKFSHRVGRRQRLHLPTEHCVQRLRIWNFITIHHGPWSCFGCLRLYTKGSTLGRLYSKIIHLGDYIPTFYTWEIVFKDYTPWILHSKIIHRGDYIPRLYTWKIIVQDYTPWRLYSKIIHLGDYIPRLHTWEMGSSIAVCDGVSLPCLDLASTSPSVFTLPSNREGWFYNNSQWYDMIIIYNLKILFLHISLSLSPPFQQRVWFAKQIEVYDMML